MTGKKVIGIAATGEKASFMWHYWLNDIIRKDIEEYKKYGKFNHSLTRVQNRSVGKPTRTNINTLPDVNLEGVEIDDVLKLSG
jgi:hydrogenase maturation factor HypF (carbamoyltransferase family)